MPKVVQFGESTVSTQVVRGPRFSDPGPFSSGPAAGLQAIGGALAGVQDRVDTTAAEEALVGFERDKNDLFFNPESGYFNTQGRNAFDGATGTNEAMEALRVKYEDQLSSPGSQRMFNEAAGAHITRGNADIMRHSATGAKVWEVATLGAQTENALENGSLLWNRPADLRVQGAMGRAAIVDAAELEGIGAEATAEKLQTFDSAFAGNTITAATAASAADGQAAMDKYGGVLEGPDKVKMDGLIEKKIKSEKTKSDAQQSVVRATAIVGRYENRQDVVDEVNKISDPELKAKTMAQAMSQFSRRRQAENELQGDTFEGAEEHLREPGGTALTYQAQDPAGWERLSPKQKSSLEKGPEVETDWDAFSELMLLPKEQLKNLNPADYFTVLDETERKTLISAVKSANGTGSSSDAVDHQTGRTRTAQTTEAVDLLFGKKTSRNDESRRKVTAFYSLIDDETVSRETQLDRKLTSEEYTDMVSGLTRTVVKERKFLPDPELDIADIPAEDVSAVSDFLRDNNIPVTADNMLKAYEQAK